MTSTNVVFVHVPCQAESSLSPPPTHTHTGCPKPSPHPSLILPLRDAHQNHTFSSCQLTVPTPCSSPFSPPPPPPQYLMLIWEARLGDKKPVGLSGIMEMFNILGCFIYHFQTWAFLFWARHHRQSFQNKSKMAQIADGRALCELVLRPFPPARRCINYGVSGYDSPSHDCMWNGLFVLLNSLTRGNWFSLSV